MTCHFLLTDSADLVQLESFHRMAIWIKGYELRAVTDEARSLRKAGSSLVAVVYLGGDFLLELGQLVLGEGAGQDLRAPFDEVVHHVPHGVKHLPFVPLRTETHR